MKTKIFACVGTAFLITQVASADPVCLRQATNQELINELSSRLSSGTGGGGTAASLQVSASCNGYNVTVSVYNAVADTSKQIAATATSESDCATYANEINAKAANLVGGGIVAVCNGYNVTKIQISTAGNVSTSAVTASSEASCAQLAQTFDH